MGNARKKLMDAGDYQQKKTNENDKYAESLTQRRKRTTITNKAKNRRENKRNNRYLLKLGTWNIQTMLQTGKMEGNSKQMKTYKTRN